MDDKLHVGILELPFDRKYHMSVVFWTGLRQVQAIRDAMAWSLGGKAIPLLKREDVERWLDGQGLGEHFSEAQDPVGTISNTLEKCRKELLDSEEYSKFMQSGQWISFSNIDDFGAERSSAGWSSVDNFCITSAFLRILGAMEQNEMDVLKALFYFRPSGVLGSKDDHVLLEPSEKDLLQVIREEPKLDGDKEIFKFPSIWTWIKKHAENRVERRSIFKNVFGISFKPQESSEKNKMFTNKQKDELYKKRNKIAHGRSSVIITLSEYVATEIHVCRSMCILKRECEVKQMLSI